MNQKEKWILNLMLQQEAENGSDREELLSVWNRERKAVRIFRQREEEKIVCEVHTTASEQPLILTAEHAQKLGRLRLVWLDYRVELWADERLADEEWPVGSCLAEGGAPKKNGRSGAQEAAVQAERTRASWPDWLRPEYSEDAVRVWLTAGAETEEGDAEEDAFREIDALREAEDLQRIEDIRYWAPQLGRHNVGDCMPFSDGETFHLFYLKDRHQHQAKWRKGAHQFAHISTKDLVHWQRHPVAVGITHQWEGSICTGSVIRAKGKYYAFYAVRMMNGSGARLSWAVSDDCVHFVKSEKYFTLQAPYETVSARDPEVFFGADGKYHMLVTTDWEEAEVPERNGCLAHLISDDLENWEQKEPFLVPGYTDQPECSDYFEWNGWYYLIFSNYGTAKYRYSRTPFGPWLCPEQEILDGLLYRVPKTAAFGDRRIAAGFLCINPEGESYAGNLILRELVQHPDGILGTSPVRELRTAQSGLHEAVTMESGKSGGYVQKGLPLSGNSVKIRIERERTNGNYGLILKAGEKAAWEIRMEPGLHTVGVYPAHSSLYYCPSKKLLTRVKGLEEGCTLEICLQGDILDLCVNGDRTLIGRLEKGYAEGNTISWSGFVKDGKAVFM